jgi:hypothetical protein
MIEGAERRNMAEAVAGLNGFILEEDPDHLEEVVLIAMDCVAQDSAVTTLFSEGYRRYRLDINSTTSLDSQPGNVHSLPEMNLGPLTLDGFNGRD